MLMRDIQKIYVHTFIKIRIRKFKYIRIKRITALRKKKKNAKWKDIWNRNKGEMLFYFFVSVKKEKKMIHEGTKIKYCSYDRVISQQESNLYVRPTNCYFFTSVKCHRWHNTIFRVGLMKFSFNIFTLFHLYVPTAVSIWRLHISFSI